MKSIFIFLFLIFLGCSNSENVKKDNQITVKGRYHTYTGNSELMRCDNNQRISIKGGEAYKELEKRYKEANLGQGESVYVEVEGSYQLIERGRGYGTELVFFVNKILVLDKNRGCF